MCLLFKNRTHPIKYIELTHSPTAFLTARKRKKTIKHEKKLCVHSLSHLIVVEIKRCVVYSVEIKILTTNFPKFIKINKTFTDENKLKEKLSFR